MFFEIIINNFTRINLKSKTYFFTINGFKIICIALKNKKYT